MPAVEHYLSSGLVITNDRTQGLVMSIPYRLQTVADGGFVCSLFYYFTRMPWSIMTWSLPKRRSDLTFFS